MKKVNTLCNNSNLNELYLNDNNDNKKLKFYSIFENDCHKSDCLNIITNINHKKTLNKFRLGNHRLQIETGKHTVPKTPQNLRICLLCHLNQVEQE